MVNVGLFSIPNGIAASIKVVIFDISRNKGPDNNFQLCKSICLYLTADDPTEKKSRALKHVADYLQKHWQGKAKSISLYS